MIWNRFEAKSLPSRVRRRKLSVYIFLRNGFELFSWRVRFGGQVFPWMIIKKTNASSVSVEGF